MWADYRISTFDILFCHLNWDEYSIVPDSKSYFDIRTGGEYLILTFEILFLLSNTGQISHFDIRIPILSFNLGRISHFFMQNAILTFELGPHYVNVSVLIKFSQKTSVFTSIIVSSP